MFHMCQYPCDAAVQNRRYALSALLLLDSPAMTFVELLAAEMARRKLSERSFSMFLGLSPTTVNRYMHGKSIPDPAACRKIAYRLGLPEEDVLRAAGHLSPATEPPELPPWLQSLLPTLAQLDDFEAATLEATAQTLLELREKRAEYEATPPPPAPPE